MSVRRLFGVSLVMLIAVVVSACSSSGEIPEADSVDSLKTALNAAGLRVEGPMPNDVLSSNYFSIPGVQFEASGEAVFAYEFDNDVDVTEQRDLVSPDGWGIGRKYIQWSSNPNYYQNGRLIVIYDGDKQLMKETLATAMGERFAGSDPA